MNRSERRQAEKKHLSRLKAFDKLTPPQQQEIKDFYAEEMNKTWDKISYELTKIMRDNKISAERIDRILLELVERVDSTDGTLKLFPIETPKTVIMTKDDFDDMSQWALVACARCPAPGTEKCPLNEIFRKFGAPTCDSTLFKAGE